MPRPNENDDENEHGTTTPDWGSPPSSPRSPPPRPSRQPAVAIRLTDSARREVARTIAQWDRSNGSLPPVPPPPPMSIATDGANAAGRCDCGICDVLQEEFHRIPGFTYQEKLNELSNCQCCDRHNRNKPHLYQPYTEFGTESELDAPPHEYHDCGCQCRHLARFICRQYPAVYVCANDEPPPTTDQLAGMIFSDNAA